MSFRSDNNAGLVPEALAALAAANDGHAIGYGDDDVTAEAVAAFRSIFGADASVWFVATGTAANTLAVASLTEPWDRVLCHAHSHWNEDESTAPERVTHCRTHAIHADDPKLTPADLERALAGRRGDVHEPRPRVVTVSNTTEFGTVYTPQEMRAICDAAHAADCLVHVDGARFANAVAATGADPRALSVDAGVDALSFGGTKNGLAAGEAVLFFRQGDGAVFERAVHAFPHHRKGTGHLLSKHRFIAAPFTATLRDGAWLRHAGHANAMATRLAGGLAGIDLAPHFPADANAVFVALPPDVDDALRAAGYGYYPFGDPAWKLSRLMCSFDTTEADVDGFVECAGGSDEATKRRSDEGP